MWVKFTVAGTLNYSTYDYIIVFNTTGNALTPLPNGGAQANYSAFSDALIVSGNSGGGVVAVPVQFVRSSGTSLPPAVIALNPPPQDVQFNANSNNLQTQFQVTFQRAIFSSLLATPTPPATPAPISKVWKTNCFVTQPGTINGSLSNYVPVDSLGIGGGTDTSYSAPDLNTAIAFDIVQNAQGPPTSDQSSTIVSCEFANTP
jgi:hypothetical protein